MVPTEYYVLLSAVLFALGGIGVLTRRSAIMLFLSVELMLNAANLAIVAYARQWSAAGAQHALPWPISAASPQPDTVNTNAAAVSALRIFMLLAPSAQRMQMISTRRFFAMPAAELLGAAGMRSP